MKPILKDLVIVFLLLAGLGHALFVYGDLPAMIPVHFDINGNPDVYATLPNGAFMLLVVGVVLAVAMRVIMTHPSAEEVKTYLHNVLIVLVGSMVALNVMILEYAMGTEIVPARFAWLITGVILVAISNPMGKLPLNKYAGVRIPGTVDNPEVWQRTNRFAGWIGVLLGLGMVVAYFAPIELPVLGLLAIVIVFVIAVVVYARRLSKQVNQQSSV